MTIIKFTTATKNPTTLSYCTLSKLLYVSYDGITKVRKFLDSQMVIITCDNSKKVFFNWFKDSRFPINTAGKAEAEKLNDFLYEAFRLSQTPDLVEGVLC